MKELKTGEFPNRINELKKKGGYTWKTISKFVFGKNVSSEVFDLASGKRLPRVKGLVRFCVLFGVSFEELYSEWYEKERKTVLELIDREVKNEKKS